MLSEYEFVAQIRAYERASHKRAWPIIGALGAFVAIVQWLAPRMPDDGIARTAFIPIVAIGLILFAAWTLVIAHRGHRATDVRCPSCGRSLIGVADRVVAHHTCPFCKSEIIDWWT